MSLTDIGVRSAKAKDRAYKKTDSAGLYLYVSKTGSKAWRFDYSFLGKRKTATIGKYPAISLVQARETRDRYREQLDQGFDPATPVYQIEDLPNSFEDVARRWVAARSDAWDDRYHKTVMFRLEGNVFGTLGAYPIDKIEAPLLLSAIRLIEGRGAKDMARRVNNLCGEIFRFGIAEGLCFRDPSADIKAALASKPSVKHRPAISENEITEFYTRFGKETDADWKDAMHLVMLTATRSGEVRFAQEDEFEGLDTDQPIWRISAERMKMRRPHLIPLPRQAVDVVKRRLGNSSGMLFASKTKSGVINENSMIDAMHRMGYYGKATVHGFRGMFSTIANEKNWNPDWIELCLAHVQGDKVRAAYNAAQYIDQRRELLQWWADFLDSKNPAV